MEISPEPDVDDAACEYCEDDEEAAEQGDALGPSHGTRGLVLRED